MSIRILHAFSLLALSVMVIGYTDDFEFKTVLPDYRPSASKANDDSGYYMITKINIESREATKLQKFDLAGLILWEKVVAIEKVHILPIKVASVPDGGVVVVSYFISQFDGVSAYISKYSTTGNLQWERRYKDFTFPIGIFNIESFIYILGSDANENGLIMKLALDGTVDSIKTLNEIGLKSHIHDGIRLANGNIAFTGDAINKESEIHCFIVIFDETLTIPQGINALESLQENRCYAITQLQTGNILVIGKTNTEPNGVLLLTFKLDSVLDSKLRMNPMDIIKTSLIPDHDYLIENSWVQSELSSFEFNLINVHNEFYIEPDEKIPDKKIPFNSILNGLIYLSCQALEEIAELSENRNKKSLRLLQYCDDGYYRNCDTCTCYICDPAYYCIGSTKYNCASGATCPGYGNSVSTYCSAGTYSLDNKSSCQSCVAGTGTPSYGYTWCPECTPGTYSYSGNPCTLCPCATYSSSYRATSSNTCIACPSNTFASAGTSSYNSCESSRPGTYTNYDRCSYSSCYAGTYNPNWNSMSSSACINCNPGTRSSTGASSCNACAPGTYQPYSGQSSCYYCTAGTYLNYYGATSNACSNCPPGTACPYTGMGSFQECTPGYYQPSYGQTACIMCPAGTGNNIYKSTSCSDCTIGTYSYSGQCIVCPTGYRCPYTRMTSPTICEYGTFQNQTSKDFCYECAPGTSRGYNGATSCDPCSKGYYQPNNKSSSCIGCSAGTYQDLTGQTACKDVDPGYYSGSYAQSQIPCATGYYADVGKLSQCKECAAGYYQDLTGQTECKICEVGTWSGQHYTTCTPCAKGYYEDTQGSTACKACPIGFYQDVNGLTDCKICGIGTYASSTGTPQCIPCAAGYFEDLEGSIGCRPCDVGTYTSTIGQSACLECPVGTSQPLTGKNVCPPCNAGSYQNQVGQTSCIPCEVGKSQALTGKTSCDDCALGKYQDVTGTSSCKACPAGQYQNVTGQTKCLDCAPGTSSAGGATTCTPCSAGYYQDISGQSSCKICPAGTYQPDTGKNSCIQCPAGKASSLTGRIALTACTDCSAGQFAIAGSATCSPCPTGYYQPDIGKGSCIECPVGKQRTTTGGTSCSDCPAGYYADMPATSNCKACAAGTYQDLTGQTGCKQCELAKYQNSAGQISCIFCPAGTYEDTLGSPLCKNCPAGQYQDLTGKTSCNQCAVGYSQPLTGKTSCVICAVGTYQDLTGQANCKPCELGKKQSLTGQTSCENCPVAYYQDQTGKTSCIICPAGKYNNDVGQAVCKDCSPGYYSNAGSTDCLLCPIGTYTGAGVGTCIPCQPGTYNPYQGQGACAKCPAGKYNSKTGSIVSTDCLDCGVGTYAPEGTGTCISCEPGKYQPNTGKGSCLLCDPGYYQDIAGKTSCIICPSGNKCPTSGTANPVPCPTGTYQPLTGKITCIDCAVGKFIGTTGNTGCIDCATGYYQDLTGQAACKACPVGKYQDAAGQNSCKDCAVGYYQNSEHMTSCIICAAGTYADITGLPTCKQCAAGTYQDGNGQTGCKQCAIGFYQPDPAKTSCVGCAVGYYQDETGKASCKPCPTGKVQPSPAKSTCDICSIGYYQDLTGQTTCKICPAGQFQELTGQASCKNCDPGYTSLNGATFCVKCLPGTYAAGGDGTCTPCPAGTYQPLDGQSSCTKCPAGTANPNTSSTSSAACSSCSIGYYAPEGSGNCMVCPTGTYQPEAAKGSCIDCEAGTYQDQTGKTSCKDCPIGSKCPAKSTINTLCPAGSIQPEAKKAVCIDCPIGKYIGTTGQTACQSCAVGYYADVPGLAACKECAPGNFQNTTEASFCYKCPIGKAQPAAHATNCVDCIAGQYAENEGSPTCTLCAKGTYQDATGQSKCIQCPLGKQASSAGSTSCTDCLAGYYQDELGMPACKACQTGKIQPLTGKSSCDDCGLGYYQDEIGKTTCKICSAGKYTDVPGSAICTDCAPGYINPTQGLSSCTKCTTGYYQNQAGQIACIICPVGTYGNIEGLAACPSCAPGTVQPLTGQQTCNDCSAGYYAPGGTTTCVICPVGTSQPNPAKGSCIDCPAGYYQELEGQSTCKACATGYAQPTPKQTTCVQCGTGYYAPEPGTPSCIPCPAGSYQNQPGKASCNKCAAGYFQANAGSSACTKCPVGKYSGSPGWTECRYPDPGWVLKPNRDGVLFKGLFANMDEYNAHPMSKTCYDSSYKVIKPFTLACKEALRSMCCTGSTKKVGIDCNYALETEGLSDTMKDNYCKACPFMDQTKCPANGVCWDETTWTTNELSIYPTTFTQACIEATKSYCLPRFQANLDDVECSVFSSMCGAKVSNGRYTDGWTTFELLLTKTLPTVLPDCKTLLDTTVTPALAEVSIACTRVNDTAIRFVIGETPRKFVRIKPTIDFTDICGLSLPQIPVLILPASGFFEILAITGQILDKCFDVTFNSAISDKYYPEPIKEQYWEITYDSDTGLTADNLARLADIGFNRTTVTIQNQDLLPGRTIKISSKLRNAFDLITTSNLLTIDIPVISEGRLFCGPCQLRDRSQCFSLTKICWNNFEDYRVTKPTLTSDCKRFMAPICFPILLENRFDPQCKDFVEFYDLEKMMIVPKLIFATFAPTGQAVIIRFSHPIRQNSIDFSTAFSPETIKWFPEPLTCTWKNATDLEIVYDPEKGEIKEFTVLDGTFFYDYEYSAHSVNTTTIKVERPTVTIDIDLQGLSNVSECDNIDIFAILKVPSLFRLIFRWEIQYSLPLDDPLYIKAKEYFEKYRPYSSISSISIPSSLIRKNLTIGIVMRSKAADVFSDEKLFTKIIKVHSSVPKIKFLSKAAHVLEIDGSKATNIPFEIDTTKCGINTGTEPDFMYIDLTFSVAIGSDPDGTNRTTSEEISIASTLNSDFAKLRRIYVGVNKGFRYYKYYQIAATVKDRGTGSENSDKIIIYLIKPQIKAIITSSSYMVNVLSDVTLSGEETLIPEQGQDKVTFLWKCKSAVSIQNGVQCSCPFFIDSIAKSKVLTIDKIKIRSFCKYVVSLSVTAASIDYTRFSNDQTEFLVVEGPAEPIKDKIIEPTVPLAKETYLTFDTGSTSNTTMDNIECEWSVVEVESLAPGATNKLSLKGEFTYSFFESVGIYVDENIKAQDNTNVTTTSNDTSNETTSSLTRDALSPKFLTSPNEPVLGVDKSSMVPFCSYTFGVKVSGMSTPTFQLMKMETQPSPRPRILTVTPQSGVGFNTSFLFTWTMTSTVQVDKASYQIFTRKCPGSENQMSPLTTKIAQSNSFTSVLAPGLKSCDEYIEVILRVFEYDYFLDITTNIKVSEPESSVEEVLSAQISKLSTNKDLTVDQKMIVMAGVSSVPVYESSLESQKVVQSVLTEVLNIANESTLIDTMPPKEQVEFLTTSTEILTDLLENQQVNFDYDMAKSAETQVNSFLTKVKTIEGGTYIIPSVIASLSGIANIASALQKEDNFSSSIEKAMNKMTEMKLKEMVIGSAGYQVTSPSLEIAIYKRYLKNAKNASLDLDTPRGTTLGISPAVSALFRSLINSTVKGTPAMGASIYSTMFNPFNNIKTNTNISLETIGENPLPNIKNDTVKKIYDDLRSGKLNETINARKLEMPLVQLKVQAMVKANNGSEVDYNFSSPINRLPDGEKIQITIALPENVDNKNISLNESQGLGNDTEFSLEDLNNTLMIPLYYDHINEIWSNTNCSVVRPVRGDKNIKMNCNHMGLNNIDMSNPFVATVDVITNIMKVISHGNYEQLTRVAELVEWNERTQTAYTTAGVIGVIVVTTLIALYISDIKALYEIKFKCLLNRVKPQTPIIQTGLFARIMQFFKKLRSKGTRNYSKKLQKTVKSEQTPEKRFFNHDTQRMETELSLQPNQNEARMNKKYKKSDGFTKLNRTEKLAILDAFALYNQCRAIYDDEEFEDLMIKEFNNNIVLNRVTYAYIDNMIWQDKVTFWSLVRHEHELLNAITEPELKTPRPSKFLIFVSIIVGELFTTGYFFDSAAKASLNDDPALFFGKAVIMSIAATTLMIPLKIFINLFMTGAELKEGMTRADVERAEKNAPIFKKIGNLFGIAWVAACTYGIIMYMIAFPNYVINNWMTSFGMSIFIQLFMISSIKVLVKSGIGLVLMSICKTRFMMTTAGVIAGGIVDFIMKYL